MESNEEKKEIYIPEVGRGCGFCDDGYEVKAVMNEGCFKLHEAQWTEGFPDNMPCDIFEVRFKNTRRGFYQNVNGLDLRRGDIVAVEASPGHDIGVISMTGDLVARQMQRVGFTPQGGEFRKIYRKAKPYDIERWQEAIALEHETMIAARQIAADMGLNMKIGDVEYQGDKIKAIFYYIADERVDFRELIKVFAERFHIRIEMKQIGARQEAGRIGGLGVCGRELCCTSWIANFTSVTTGAARTQELSLNPQKMAGQCSKLKCCLMYEYDTYADARKIFPRVKEPLQALDGDYFLIKSDILAGTMTFSSSKESLSNLITLPVDRVREIQEMNLAGEKVEQLSDAETEEEMIEEPTYRSEEDSITRFDGKRRKRSGKKRKNQQSSQPRDAKENGKDPKEGGREARDGKENKDPKEGKENRRPKEPGEPKESREPKGSGGPKEPQERKEPGAQSSAAQQPAMQQPAAQPSAKSGPAQQRQGNNRTENRGETAVRRTSSASSSPAPTATITAGVPTTVKAAPAATTTAETAVKTPVEPAPETAAGTAAETPATTPKSNRQPRPRKMTYRRNKADGDAPYRAPRTGEAQQGYAPAIRATRFQRALQRIASTVASTVTAAAKMILIKTAAAARTAAMAKIASIPATAAAKTIMTKTTAAPRTAARTKIAAMPATAVAKMIVAKAAAAPRTAARTKIAAIAATAAVKMIVAKATAAARTAAIAKIAAMAATVAPKMILAKMAVATRTAAIAKIAAMLATVVAPKPIMARTAAAARSMVMAAMICMAVGLAGCRGVDEMVMADVPVRNWHHGVELKVTPPDTETLYDLDLLVRYNHNFTVDTLTLWFRTQTTDTLIYTERCRFQLPMSERPAAIRPVVGLPWRCGVRFSAPQPCRIRITPLQPVRGIEAVGIRLRPVVPTSVTQPQPQSVTQIQEEE